MQKQSQNKPNQTQFMMSKIGLFIVRLLSQSPILTTQPINQLPITNYRLPVNYFFLAFFFFGLAFLTALQPQVLHILLSFHNTELHRFRHGLTLLIIIIYLCDLCGKKTILLLLSFCRIERQSAAGHCPAQSHIG
jgi:hypothetical protein